MAPPDSPRPADLIVRRSDRQRGIGLSEEWVLCAWPDVQVVIAGPFTSYVYAFLEARDRLTEPSKSIWRHHGRWQKLQLVTAGS
jgi:hypothetical protein